jgi:Domain of unknown function (DUF4159)
LNTPRKILLLILATGLVAGICTAQNWGRRSRIWPDVNANSPIVQTEGRPPAFVNEDTVRTARETARHGDANLPDWTNAPGFERDVFTFVRIMYKYTRYGENPRVSGSSSPWGWITDYPDSDLNLSYRLQQLTSLGTNPDGRVLRLTDPALADYPFIYMVEPGRMQLRDEEIPVLRHYLLNGGVLMADDFWGQKQWDNFEYWMQKVLPERHWVELPMDHPLFHCVFDIKVPKNQLQTPNSTQGARSLVPGERDYGITWEYYHDDYDNDDGQGRAAHDMHVRAWLDDKGRIMVIGTHNCDNGDAWEREGDDDGFFHEFSEKRGYPLGINLIYYLMTH